MVPTVATTRIALQQVAVHVLARRRHDVTRRFGLRPSAGGVATPAFVVGDDVEVVRTSGRFLVVERGGAMTAAPMTTLAAAAELVGVDLEAEFSVGSDTPAPRHPAAALDIDDGAARTLGDWWAFGREVIDEAIAGAIATGGSAPAATVAQLWPEHFDLGATLELGAEHVNVGASPGDVFSDEPYLYVGPWSAARPGDPAYWNAPFGAALTSSALAAASADASDPARAAARRTAAVEFLTTGLSRF